MNNVEEIIQSGTLILAVIIEGFAGLVIAHAVIRAIFIYGQHAIINKVSDFQIRSSLGRALVIALEFLLAADILRTAVAPNWDSIGKLGAIAALRTIMNYFLEKEISKSLPKS